MLPNILIVQRYNEKKPDVLGFKYECERTRIFKTCIFVVPRTAEIVFDINGLMEKCKQKFSNWKNALRISNCFSQKIIFVLVYTKKRRKETSLLLKLRLFKSSIQNWLVGLPRPYKCKLDYFLQFVDMYYVHIHLWKAKKIVHFKVEKKLCSTFTCCFRNSETKLQFRKLV